MKKITLFLLLLVTLFSFTLLETNAITYEDDQLPVNLINNPHATKSWVDAYAQDYWEMYSNYNFYDDGLVVYFPSADENDDHLWYTINSNPPEFYQWSGVEFYDSGYNQVDFIAFVDTDEYISDVYGAWYSFETLEISVTYFRVKMLYAGDSSYASDMQAQTLNSTLYATQGSTFVNWYLNQFASFTNGYYNAGYNDAEVFFTNRMYEYGTAIFGFNEENSYDYIEGYAKGLIDGGAKNVNAGIITFLENFQNWIVPSIIVVMFLGYILHRRRKRGV